MDKGSVLFIFINIIGFCFIFYNSIPSKYKKLEEKFGGFMNRSLIRFEYIKSPLHTNVYGGNGTGKTYFMRQFLKLYLDQDQDLRNSLVNHKQSSFTDQIKAKNIIIVCEDDRDWIDPETGELYIGFNECDINLITSKIKSKFKDSVIVLDDMGDKLNKDKAFFHRRKTL